jgi:hypothetical protein
MLKLVGERANDVRHYAYRAGAPIVFDARMLHMAEPNAGQHHRVILWWIYNKHS